MEAVLKNVAVAIMNGFTPFELGAVCEVFGADRTDDGLPADDFAVGCRVRVKRAPATMALQQPRPQDRPLLTSAAGGHPSMPHGLDRLGEADLVAVAAVSDNQIGPHTSGPFPVPLTEALRATVDRGARVSASAPARSCSVPPGCWTACGAPRTGGTPRPLRGRIRQPSSTPTCCTFTRTR